MVYRTRNTLKGLLLRFFVINFLLSLGYSIWLTLGTCHFRTLRLHIYKQNLLFIFLGDFLTWLGPTTSSHQTILLGDSGVGKTSFLIKYHTGDFRLGSFSATVGIALTVSNTLFCLNLIFILGVIVYPCLWCLRPKRVSTTCLLDWWYYHARIVAVLCE